MLSTILLCRLWLGVKIVVLDSNPMKIPVTVSVGPTTTEIHIRQPIVPEASKLATETT